MNSSVPEEEPSLFESDGDGTVWWTFSQKWMNRRLDCTLEGVTRSGGCGAGCCKRPSYWPPSAEPRSSEGCHFLGPTGCTLGDERPLTCHLYPLRIDRRNLVGCMRSGVVPNSVCDHCWNKGPKMVDALRASIEYIFGKEKADWAVAEILRGVNPTLKVPSWAVEALKREELWEGANELPQKRPPRL